MVRKPTYEQLKQRVRELERKCSEQEQTEVALRENEQEWLSILANAPDFVLKVDRAGRILFINRGVAGVMPEQTIGKKIYEYIPPEDHATTKEAIEHVFKTGRSISFETSVDLPDGSTTWFMNRLGPIKRANQVVAVTQISTDITALKETEETLQKRTHVLGERVKELNCLYGISDLVEKPDISLGGILQGVVDLVPTSWQYPEIACSRIILDGEEFRTKNFKDSAWKQTCDIVVQGEHFGTLEVCYLEEKPECEEGPFLTEERLLINAVSGRLGRIIELQRGQDALQEAYDDLERRVEERTADLVVANEKLSQEIAVRLRKEEALRKSEARYRAIVEDQTELICRFLPDGKLTFVNDAYCRYFQKRRDELVEHTFIPLIPEEDREKVQRHLAALGPENPFASHEHRVLAPDGEIRWQRWTNRMILDEQGNPCEFQSVGRDITDRKQAEKALKESSEKIKMFAYSVSHDLKSPAIGIYGLTKLLHKQYRDLLDEKAKSYCDKILSASEQIAGLVEQINVFISTKETPLIIERIRPKEILRMLRDEFSPQLNIRQINWSEPESIPDMKADRISLLRVMRNFIDNALKHGGDALSEIKVGYSASDQFHILSVADDGIGLKEQDSERLFGPFSRMESSRGIEGAGLGLAIVKEIAQRQGGKVWVGPGLKTGTAFHIAIPIDPPSSS
jgi:PAS domain S-box-containing protein